MVESQDAATVDRCIRYLKSVIAEQAGMGFPQEPLGVIGSCIPFCINRWNNAHQVRHALTACAWV